MAADFGGGGADDSAIDGPRWQLEDEYADEAAAEVDVAAVAACVAEGSELLALAATLAAAVSSGAVADEATSLQLVATAAKAHAVQQEASTALTNVQTYATCRTSVDGTDEAARKLTSRCESLRSRLVQAVEPLEQWLTLVPEACAESYLASGGRAAGERWRISRLRSQRSHMLPLREEELLTALEVPGLHAWGRMYTDTTSTLRVEVRGRSLGLAQCNKLLNSPDEGLRRDAFRAREAALARVEEPCAAALNAMAGWRGEVAQRRGLGGALHGSLHSNCLAEASLGAMMSAVDRRGAVAGRRALRTLARTMGKERVDAWDLLAPAPRPPGGNGGGGGHSLRTFEQAVAVVEGALREVSGDMADFVRMVVDRGWVEGSRGPSKRTGAFCTKFMRSRHPRVYTSGFTGRNSDVKTLAHELGHAYHNWVMRDLPQGEIRYPMCLAETASLLFEQIVGAALARSASSAAERLESAHEEAGRVHTFLVNIPARFRLEREYCARRPSGTLSAREYTALCRESLAHYYEGTVSEEMDARFWQWKLHFYLSRQEFYNWPYTFGYLFALGVWAQRDRLGPEAFVASYVALLRDTGRMSCEELVRKHLGADIQDEAFWLQSIALAEAKVDHYEAAAAAANPAWAPERGGG